MCGREFPDSRSTLNLAYLRRRDQGVDYFIKFEQFEKGRWIKIEIKLNHRLNYGEKDARLRYKIWKKGHKNRKDIRKTRLAKVSVGLEIIQS